MNMDAIFQTIFWQTALWGNSVFYYVAAILIFVGAIFALKWIQWIVLRSVKGVTKRTKTELDDALVEVVNTIRPPFYSFISFYIALRYLSVSGVAKKMIDVMLLVWLVYQVVVAFRIFIEYYVKQRMARTDDKRSQSVIQIIHSLVSVILWAMAGLFILSNLGVNITSLVAGLGVGGIAVALAAQNILGDLFSSLAIYFDKPFVPGDFVVVGDHKGTVQSVGIKTTRIKSVDGEEIVVPNKEMTSATLKNFGRMVERRVKFTFGVAYETSTTKLKRISGIVKKAVKDLDNAEFDRVHFNDFGDSALGFEVVYFMKTKEYDEYMDAHEKVLFAIRERFEEEGIEMAYPTRMVYVKQV
jgi:small-conductance mechanosensitive channel